MARGHDSQIQGPIALIHAGQTAMMAPVSSIHGNKKNLPGQTSPLLPCHSASAIIKKKNSASARTDCSQWWYSVLHV